MKTASNNTPSNALDLVLGTLLVVFAAVIVLIGVAAALAGGVIVGTWIIPVMGWLLENVL